MGTATDWKRTAGHAERTCSPDDRLWYCGRVPVDGYVPGFEWDVFVSYAHLSDDADGWVTRFCAELEKKLSSVLDRKAKVWFDDTGLKAGDQINEKIRTDLPKVAVLVPVLSPAYVDSEFCTVVELGAFPGAGEGRVFPVAKLPFEEGQVSPLPSAVKCLYFYKDTEAGCEQFNADDLRFEAVMRELAQAIVAKLRQMRRSRQRIYVSRPKPFTTDELLRRAHESLRKEFYGQGYLVLPNQVVTEQTSQDVIRQWQEQCNVVVLLSGSEADEVTERQLSVARDLEKACVIAVTDLDRAAQRLWTGDPAILLTRQGWHEEIIERVMGKLQPPIEPAPLTEARSVYLLCSPEDYEASNELRKLILANVAGFEVMLPEFSLGDPFKFLKDHEDKLRRCEGLILYWGHAERSWFASQDAEEVPRAINWLRKRPYAAEAKYLSIPDNPEKRRVGPKRREFIIRGFEGPNVADLRPFLETIPNPPGALGGRV
jgi:hypothetical protein